MCFAKFQLALYPILLFSYTYIIGDKIGLRLAGLIFVSLTLAGVIIVAFAPSFENAYIVMAIGRTVFGYVQQFIIIIYHIYIINLPCGKLIINQISRSGSNLKFFVIQFAACIQSAFNNFRINYTILIYPIIVWVLNH